MSNFLIVRVAVNLCLIAAIVIQPMAIVAAQGTCVQDRCCEAPAVCHACNRCEVERDRDLCGCCAKETERPNQDGLAEDQVTLSSCGCGIRSEPIAPAPHRVPVPEVRDLVVIAYLDHVAFGAENLIRPARLISRLPIGDHSPHFSQRILCIWRI